MSARDVVEYLRRVCAARRKPKRGEPAPAFVVSEGAKRCAELLERWCGLHHIDSIALARADWSRDCVALKLHGSIGSTDFDEMTRLVFLAHDLAIRVEVSASMNYLELMLSPRKREGGAWAWDSHPTIEAALGRWRERNPEVV